MLLDITAHDEPRLHSKSSTMRISQNFMRVAANMCVDIFHNETCAFTIIIAASFDALRHQRHISQKASSKILMF